MFPHERSLVKKMDGKPFALVGVNGDGDDPELKKKNEKQEITWRSFKNERPGKTEITDEWNLEGWPTLYVIDHKGIIRHKWLGNPGNDTVDKAIEELVEKAEKESGQK